MWYTMQEAQLIAGNAERAAEAARAIKASAAMVAATKAADAPLILPDAPLPKAAWTPRGTFSMPESTAPFAPVATGSLPSQPTSIIAELVRFLFVLIVGTSGGLMFLWMLVSLSSG